MAAIATAATAVAGPAEAASVPSAPLNPAAFADGAHRLLVNWDAPASTGGSNLESYLIDISDAAGPRWFVTAASAPGGATTAVVGGLQPGISGARRCAAGTPPSSPPSAGIDRGSPGWPA